MALTGRGLSSNVRVYPMSSIPPELTEEEYEAEVRLRLLHNLYPPNEVKFAEEWLRKFEARRSASSSAKRDAREEETLSVAKEANTIALAAASAAADANDIARFARTISVIAAIAAIVAAVAAIKWR